MKKRKYEYWHEIIAVSVEYAKKHPNLKVGLCITNQFKKDNESVCMIDIKTGKEYPSAYTLKYLGRLPINLTWTEKVNKLKKLQILRSSLSKTK